MDLRASGSLKVLPVHASLPGAMDAVLVNTAGGLTGGDRFDLDARLGPGAHLRLTTVGAERAYRADADAASVAARVVVDRDARIDWLPQETILYDGGRLDRHLRVELAPGATALIVEGVVLGRAAMGETVRSGSLRDAREVWRDGRLVHVDRVQIGRGDWDGLDRPATLGGARAFASVILAGPRAESALGPLRASLAPGAGASLVRADVLLVRLLAPDGLTLRQRLVPIIEALGGAPLPVSWTL